MGLVNIEQWRAERGIGPQVQGTAGAAGAGGYNGALPDPTAPLLAQIGALEAEIARQADLVTRLQVALTAYVDRDERARAAQLAQLRAVQARAIPKPKKARVIRRPRRR